MISMFSWFDAVIGIVILIFGYVGFRTGIIASIFYILSSVACMLYLNQIHAKLGPYFYGSIIIVMAFVLLLGFILSFLFQKIVPSILDKVLGLIIGMLLGLIVAVNFVVPIAISKKLPASIHKASKISYSVLKIEPKVKDYFTKIVGYGNGKLKQKAGKAVKELNNKK